MPREDQQKVLLFGIVFALIARTGFIFLGAALINSFAWIFYLFGLILLLTAGNMLMPEGEESHSGDDVIVLLARKVPGNHHDLGLFGVGDQPPRPRGGLGLYHLAWQVDTIEDLKHARLTLAYLDALTGESSHGATKSLYGRDPDGNEFEVMWMLPKAHWGEFENSAPIERLDLPGEVRRWAGVRTAPELVPVDAS